MLGVDGALDVGRIAAKFSVSEATVRRDLQLLEDEGLLRRTHGGAVLPFESTAAYPHHDSKLQRQQLEKAAIARCAARKVSDGDVVVLDSGTTTMWLARELRSKRDLTIVTSDLKIALEVADVAGFEVLCVGGTGVRQLVGPRRGRFMRAARVNRRLSRDPGCAYASGGLAGGR